MEWIQTITEWAKTLFEQTGFRPAALPLAFLLGLVSAVASACCTLPVLGAIVGYSGTQKRSGHRSNLLAALLFKLSQRGASKNKSKPEGLVGAAVVGFIMGGGVSVCSLACNPGIYIVLGVAVLQGYTLWAMAILAAYAIGFSLSLAAIMLGVSFGSSAIKAKKAEVAIRITGGVLLIAAGFYFLSTL
ncbi:MAG: hypothetical protein ACYSSL_03450 [Planctomycetota bacterium]|jgi:cytochrome c biogenesis protein CcdA